MLLNSGKKKGSVFYGESDTRRSTSIRLGESEFLILHELQERLDKLMPQRSKKASRTDVIRTLLRYAAETEAVNDERLLDAYYEIL